MKNAVHEDAHEDDPVLERFHFLVNAPALFNAVTTAAELRIFAFLSGSPGASAAEIRSFCGLPAHQLRVLLQAVCTTGLLERRGGVYHNSSVAEELLAADAEPDSWSHILTGWKEVYYPAFADMTAALRAGTNTALSAHPGDEPTLYGRLARNPPLEEVFHRAMTAFTLRSVDALIGQPVFEDVRAARARCGRRRRQHLGKAGRTPSAAPDDGVRHAERLPARVRHGGGAAGAGERGTR